MWLRALIGVSVAIVVMVPWVFFITRGASLNRKQYFRLFSFIVSSIIWMFFIVWLKDFLEENHLWNPIKIAETYWSEDIMWIVVFLPRVLYVLWRYLIKKEVENLSAEWKETIYTIRNLLLGLVVLLLLAVVFKKYSF